MAVIFLQVLYWLLLIGWSAVITYIVLFVFFPEKVRHHHETTEEVNTASFARHRFQKLPGNDALTVTDIVTALSHSKTVVPSVVHTEEHPEHQEDDSSEEEESH